MLYTETYSVICNCNMSLYAQMLTLMIMVQSHYKCLITLCYFLCRPIFDNCPKCKHILLNTYNTYCWSKLICVVLHSHNDNEFERENWDTFRMNSMCWIWVNDIVPNDFILKSLHFNLNQETHGPLLTLSGPETKT